MKLKTRTAALITQKQNIYAKQKQGKTNLREKSVNIIHTSKQLPNSSNNNHLKHCNTLALAIQPDKSAQKNKNVSDMLHDQSQNRKCQECWSLEKQNYRLIQSNYNMLARHASIMEKIRKDLLKVIFMIQQYHYVQAVKTVYDLLEKMRNIHDKQKNKQILNCESEDQNYQTDKCRLEMSKLSSKVENYNFPQKSQLQLPKQVNFRRQLGYCYQNIQEQHRPEVISVKKQNEEEAVSPRFRHNVVDHYKQLLWYEDEIQVTSLKQSMQQIPNNYFQTIPRSDYSFQQRPFSQKNIKFYRQKKPFSGEVMQVNKNEDLYRMMLMQASTIQATFID